MVLEISGQGVDSLLAEAGGHRIQRVPSNERRGRVHTSTVTVSVLSAMIKPPRNRAASDFRVEWFRGSGAGGQHRNKHANSARVIHIPTGLRREVQGRHRESNLREAMEAINRDLDRMEAESAHGARAAITRAQIGSGMRGDKFRTYRFQDDRVTDHRTGKTCRTTDVMRGRFRLLW